MANVDRVLQRNLDYWQTRDYGQEFIRCCREKLPKINLPIEIGSTGLIELTGSPSATRGWTVDRVGRMVVIVDDVILFQRYVNYEVFTWGYIDKVYPTQSTFSNTVDQPFLKKFIADM
jgi:hypothetical protein